MSVLLAGIFGGIIAGILIKEFYDWVRYERTPEPAECTEFAKAGENTKPLKPVYLCHRYADDPAGNEARCINIARIIKKTFPDIALFAPQFYFNKIYNEKTERPAIMRACLEYLANSREIWVNINDPKISAGMADEIAEAVRLGIIARYFMIDTDTYRIYFVPAPGPGAA